MQRIVSCDEDRNVCGSGIKIICKSVDVSLRILAVGVEPAGCAEAVDPVVVGNLSLADSCEAGSVCEAAVELGLLAVGVVHNHFIDLGNFLFIAR